MDPVLSSSLWIIFGVFGIIFSPVQCKVILLTLQPLFQMYPITQFVFEHIKTKLKVPLLLTLILIYGLFLTFPVIYPPLVSLVCSIFFFLFEIGLSFFF